MREAMISAAKLGAGWGGGGRASPMSDDLIGYDQMTEEAWARLEAGANEPTHPMRLLAFTNVDQDGHPAVRTLVLRGASREEARLWFHADQRSKKMIDLRRQAHVAILGYDPGDGVQLRCRGTAIIHEQDDVCEHHWEQVSFAVRYIYESVSGQRYSSMRDPEMGRLAVAMKEGTESTGYDNFAVLEIVLEEIEWLQISEGEQRRAVLCERDHWAVRPMDP